MSPPNMAIYKMLDETPIPATTVPGELYKVTICGSTYLLRASAAPKAGLDTFELFGGLPGELQTKILGFAAEGRTIIATEVLKFKSADEIAGKMGAKKHSTFHFTGAAMPLIFQVCKAVKKVAPSLGYKAMFRTRGSSKAVYFNPRVDVLEVRVPHLRNLLCDTEQLCTVLQNPLDLGLVRELRMPLATFDCHQNMVLLDINAMTGLQFLHLYGAIPTFETHPLFTLKLNFEDLKGQGVVPVAHIPGKKLIANDAMNSVNTYVPSAYHQGHINHLMVLFSRLMHGPEPFPSTVKMEILYYSD